MAKYDYRGIIHCHSTYSDGTGDMEEIGKAANDAGLDFVMMTDHDQMKPGARVRARVKLPVIEKSERNEDQQQHATADERAVAKCIGRRRIE